MESKMRTRFALLVAVVGIIVTLVVMMLWGNSKPFKNGLAELAILDVKLAKIEALASALDEGNYFRVIGQWNQEIKFFQQENEQQAIREFLSSRENLFSQLANDVANITALTNDYSQQMAASPDSLRAGISARHLPRIESGTQALQTTITQIKDDIAGYRNSLTAGSTFNRKVAAVLALLAVFGSLTYLTYVTCGKVADRESRYRERILKEEKRLEAIQQFIESISDGRLNEEVLFEKGDQLAEKMVAMKKKLVEAAEADRKRNWTNEGLAELGQILRNPSSTEDLYFTITRFCVKYTKSSQASLFVLSDGDTADRYLELVSTYAYDRKKFLQKKIFLGEGLAGQCVLEGQTIYMTQLPPNYLSITSGLGGATPSSLLIVPLKLNDKVYGVIEMASFNCFEPHQIEFMEKVGDSVASSISAAKISDHTHALLEKSQQQTEELRAQEEEMRQNMEELSATQEQMARQMEESRRMAEDLQIRENVFALTTILSESDLYGNIIVANDKLVEVSQYSRAELIGKPHKIFRHPDMPKALFKLFWDTIKQGDVFRGIIKNRRKDGGHYWVDATIVPIKDENGKVRKYIGARYHITDDSIATMLYNRQAERLGLPRLGVSQQVEENVPVAS